MTRRLRCRARRFVAAPLAIAGTAAYALSQVFDVTHAMVSGEAYE